MLGEEITAAQLTKEVAYGLSDEFNITFEPENASLDRFIEVDSENREIWVHNTEAEFEAEIAVYLSQTESEFEDVLGVSFEYEVSFNEYESEDGWLTHIENIRLT